MATKNIEIQDSDGNIYYPHTNANVVKVGDKTLTNVIGDTTTLKTNDKTNLVNAVNEAFQSASNGKNKIVTAITGTDPGITIPNNPTFDDLATAITSIETGIDTTDASANEHAILSGYRFYGQGKAIDGAMPDYSRKEVGIPHYQIKGWKGSWAQIKSPVTGRIDQDTTLSLDIYDLHPHNIKSGVKIGSPDVNGGYIEGTFTSDGTVSSGDVLSGKICYSDSARIVGTITDRRNTVISANSGTNAVTDVTSQWETTSGKGCNLRFNLNFSGYVDSNTSVAQSVYGLHPSIIKKGELIGANTTSTGKNRIVGTYDGAEDTVFNFDLALQDWAPGYPRTGTIWINRPTTNAFTKVRVVEGLTPAIADNEIWIVVPPMRNQYMWRSGNKKTLSGKTLAFESIKNYNTSSAQWNVTSVPGSYDEWLERPYAVYNKLNGVVQLENAHMYDGTNWIEISSAGNYALISNNTTYNTATTTQVYAYNTGSGLTDLLTSVNASTPTYPGGTYNRTRLSISKDGTYFMSVTGSMPTIYKRRGTAHSVYYTLPSTLTHNGVQYTTVGSTGYYLTKSGRLAVFMIQSNNKSNFAVFILSDNGSTFTVSKVSAVQGVGTGYSINGSVILCDDTGTFVFAQVCFDNFSSYRDYYAFNTLGSWKVFNHSSSNIANLQTSTFSADNKTCVMTWGSILLWRTLDYVNETIGNKATVNTNSYTYLQDYISVHDLVVHSQSNTVPSVTNSSGINYGISGITLSNASNLTFNGSGTFALHIKGNVIEFCRCIIDTNKRTVAFTIISTKNISGATIGRMVPYQ